MDRVKALLSWLKDLALRGFAIFQANKMSVYSGYATLFIVTAIFPCIILIISIVNLLPGYSTKDVADIFFQILPDLGRCEMHLQAQFPRGDPLHLSVDQLSEKTVVSRQS